MISYIAVAAPFALAATLRVHLYNAACNAPHARAAGVAYARCMPRMAVINAAGALPSLRWHADEQLASPGQRGADRSAR